MESLPLSRTLWLWLLPLLYLPTLSLGVDTGFGVFEISDYLIFPFLLSTLWAEKQSHGFLARELNRPALMFIVWSALGVLLMGFFYQYHTSKQLVFSLLKLAKFALYGYAGLRVSRLLVNDEVRKRFHSSLILAGLLSAGALAVLAYLNSMAPVKIEGAFKSLNSIGATISAILAYLGTQYLNRYGSNRWRFYLSFGLILMITGFAFSQSRGAWAASLLGFAYAIVHQPMRPRIVGGLLAGLAALLLLYDYAPPFRDQIDKTINPDQRVLETYNIGIGGIDEGGRLMTWAHEAPRLADAPIMGTGFYHRGDRTTLWSTGSHNFWLQIFLETGIVGGLIVIYMFILLWRHTKASAETDHHLSLALRTTLVVVFIVALSGEYLYGGMTLFTVLAIYGLAGSLRRE